MWFEEQYISGKGHDFPRKCGGKFRIYLPRLQCGEILTEKLRIMTCEMGNISDANMLFSVVTAVLFLTFTLYVTAPE